VLARETGRPPRAVAEALARAFPRDPELFESVEIAGPGFINFRYAPAFLARLPARIAAAGERFGASDAGAGTRVLVEYVSANPTGPLNVVSARAAAVGATLVRLLDATGFEAQSEFYVNDAGTQVDLLGESVAARFAERVGLERPFPEPGYRGAYVAEIAAALPEAEALAALAAGGGDWFRDQALERMIAGQQRDLADYGVEFARWFRESELHRSGAVMAALRELEAAGMTYRSREPQEWKGDRPPAPEERKRERMLPKDALIPLLLFSALLLVFSLHTMAASGQFPREHRAPALASGLGAIVLYGTIVVAAGSLLIALLVAWRVIPC